MQQKLVSIGIVICAMIYSISLQAADIGPKKPDVFGPSLVFAPNQFKTIQSSLSIGITTAFAAALFQEIHLPARASNGAEFSGPNGFFFNVSSGIGFGIASGATHSNFSMVSIQDSGGGAAIIFSAPSTGQYVRRSALPASGASVGYHMSVGRFVFGPVLEGYWHQVRSDILSSGYYDIDPVTAVRPLHRVGSNFLGFGSANARVGWMLNERWLAYLQAGPALAYAVVATGFGEPAGLVWKQQHRTLVGGSVGVGLSYQTAAEWTLGIEASSAWFKPVRVQTYDASSKYYSSATIRHRYPALKLSIGRQL